MALEANMLKHLHEALACIVVWAATLPANSVFAEDAPRSYVVSPDVYRVIAENETTKVILATWKSGQRDNWHSHPANRGSSDCRMIIVEQEH
jgi:hypothetical protein